jgi:hypothetical protein
VVPDSSILLLRLPANMRVNMELTCSRGRLGYLRIARAYGFCKSVFIFAA